MKRILLTMAMLLLSGVCLAQERATMSQEQIAKAVENTIEKYNHRSKSGYERLSADDLVAIADNVLLYQNEDGGWAKNLDMMSKLPPKEVIVALPAHRRRSTIDNQTVYPEIALLSTVYTVTGDERYRLAAERALEYLLSTQYPNGGWRGWDADAITFNDGVTGNVMNLWLDVMKHKEQYDWLSKEYRERIAKSFDKALECVLRCQYVQNGVKTVWAQQYDHQTFEPCKARAYEFPGLAAGESAGLVEMLMRISKPSAEVIDAVKCAVEWFERSKIEGIRLKIVAIPEDEREEEGVTKTRVLVKDPDAKPMWARYYELDTNRPFFSDRRGEKLYDYMEISQERRAGYGWYGYWGERLQEKYEKWKKKL